MGPVAIGGGIGLPGLLILLLVMFLNGGGGGDSGGDFGASFDGFDQPRGPADGSYIGSDREERLVDFMSFVLDDVQGFWSDTFRRSGKAYRRAKLVVFTQQTGSGCGGASANFGPHYCPADEHVYLDLSFFRELRDRYGAPGDFAQAYVLAHEVAHHVQHVMGITSRVRQEQQTDQGRANELSIRLELQADCLAGVWAFTTYERELLERGDLQEGLDAAAAVGDDRLQEQATGSVDHETWTHGSSEQRMHWFSAGYADGDPNSCDTFSTEAL
jgi:predicted metalloprotease